MQDVLCRNLVAKGSEDDRKYPSEVLTVLETLAVWLCGL